MPNYYNPNTPVHLPANEETVRHGIGEVLYKQDQTNYMVMNELNALRNDLLYERRKKKRKRLGCDVFFNNNNLEYKMYFSDDNNDSDIIAYNVGSFYKISNITFKGVNCKHKYFMIGFDSGICVIGRVNKRGGNDLYRYFLEAGVQLNNAISKTIIYTALESEFTPKIANCLEIEEVETLAGWTFANTYNNADRCLNVMNRCDVMIPAQSKHLSEIRENAFDNYFRELNRISRDDYRILIFIYPFIGILNSLLNERKMKLDKCIVFVDMDNIDKDIITNWFQIFNRDEIMVNDLKMSDKELCNILELNKDEVVLFDLQINAYSSTYEKNKQLNNARKVIDVTTGKTCLLGKSIKDMNVTAAIITNQMIKGDNVVNIFIDNSLFSEERKLANNDEFGSIFTSFIEYAERHFNSIVEKMDKHREATGVNKILSIVYEIINDYFEIKGFDVSKELNLLKSIDWDTIINNKENDLGVDELINRFIAAMRKSAVNYCFVDIAEISELNDDVILVDKEYLFISRNIFENILDENGMSVYIRELLCELVNEEFLIGSNEGLMVKKQINGVRKLYYKIRKDIFNSVGNIIIENLGRSVE